MVSNILRIGVLAAGLLLITGPFLQPGPARADPGTETVTIALSATRVSSGSKVTVSGTVTEGGAPVAGTPVTAIVNDAVNGGAERHATTSAAGAWSMVITVGGDTTVTAYTDDMASNQATATIAATAKVTLKMAGWVARPMLLDPAAIAVAPANWTTPVLQVRQAGTSTWKTTPDSSGAWGNKAGTVYVRAVAPGYSGLFGQGVSPTVTVTVKNGKIPAWLKELNAYRLLNNAPPAAENSHWSYGDSLHVRYMEKTGEFTHAENPKSKWYTKLGALAGESSDLAYSPFPGLDPIRGWAGAPYHALSELSKSATMAGYSVGGAYSALWTSSIAPFLHPTQPYYQYPANGRTTSLLAYSGDESPDPLRTCPKAWRDGQWVGVGLPVIFGNQSPVSKPSAAVTSGGTSLKVCVVNAGIYGNAVFIIPLKPLKPRHTYKVTVKYDGKLQSKWAFKTS